MPPEPPPAPTDVSTVSTPFNFDRAAWRIVVNATNLRVEHSLTFTPFDFIVDLTRPLDSITLGGMFAVIDALPDYSAVGVAEEFRDEPATTLIEGVFQQSTGFDIIVQALL